MEESLFHVELFFDGEQSILSIPYSSILVFADPGIGFAISRKTHEEW